MSVVVGALLTLCLLSVRPPLLELLRQSGGQTLRVLSDLPVFSGALIMAPLFTSPSPDPSNRRSHTVEMPIGPARQRYCEAYIRSCVQNTEHSVWHLVGAR